MQANLDDFKTGWYGVLLGLKEEEIEHLIEALKNLKKHKTHFHFRSKFEGDGGIGDIELYYQTDEGTSNMDLEASTKPSRE